jgi:hypothetical protein
MFDSWSEYYHHDRWMEALADSGLTPDFYTTRVRADEEIFPWDFIDCGVTKAFLLREWHRARQGVTSPNCREQCQGCGATCFGIGICPTADDNEKGVL